MINTKLIKARMKELGITQKELAARLGTTEGHVSKVLKGKFSLSVSMRMKISLELQIPYKDIYEMEFKEEDDF